MRGAVFYAFRDFEPVEKAKDGSDMTGRRSFNDSTSNKVPNLLETGHLRLTEC